MTQTSRLVLEIDSRDAEQKAADVRKALGAMEDAGLNIKPAMDKAGAGLDGLGKAAHKTGGSLDQLGQSTEKSGSATTRAAETYDQASARLLVMAKNSLQASDYIKSLSASTDAASLAFNEASNKASSLAALQKRLQAESDALAGATDRSSTSSKRASAATEAQARDLADLIGKIDPTVAALKKLDAAQDKLSKFNASGILPDGEFSKYTEKLDQARQRLGTFDDSLQKTGVSSAQTTAALRQLPAQFTDIFTSLAGGQNPLMVLIQQGGQIKDSFGGIGNTVDVLGDKVKGFFSSIIGSSSSIAGAGAALGELAAQQNAVAQGSEAAADGLGGVAEGANTASDAAKNAREAVSTLGAGAGGAGISMLALVGAATAAAAAIGLLIYGYNKGSKEADTYNNALILTGNFAGTSASQLGAMAERIGDATTTVGDAAAALARLSGSAKIPASQFEAIATAALNMEDATGKAVGETIAEFEKIADSPTKAIADLNEKYGFLTASIYEQIRALEDQGDKQGAATIAEGAYASAMEARSAKIKANLGTIERAWQGVTSAAKSGWDAILDIGRESSFDAKIANAQKALDSLKKFGGTVSVLGLNKAFYGEDGQRQLQVLIDEYKSINKQQIESTKEEGEKTRATEAAIEASGRLLKIEESAYTKKQKMNKELEAARLDIETKRAGGLKVTAEQEEALYKVIREKSEYKEAAAKKEKAYAEDAGTKMLDQARQQYAVLQQQNVQISTQAVGTKALGTEAKKLIELEQMLADIKGKQTLTADQKSILAKADQLVGQQKINAELEKQTALLKEAGEEARKLAAFQENINSQLELAQEGLSNQLAGIGMGSKARQRILEDLKIRQDYQKQLNALTKSYNESTRDEFSQDRYDKETEALRSALDKRLGMQQDYYRNLDAAQADWTNGASAALQDYIDEAGDIASQTYELYSNALHGIEDEFVDLATKGKFSFHDLTESIIADLARIAAKTMVVQPLISALFGGNAGGGSGGAGGLVGSLFGGSSSDSGGSGGLFSGLAGIGKNLYSAWNTITGVGSSVASGYASGGIGGAISGGAGYYGNMLSSIASTLSSGFTSLVGGNIAITGATAAGTAATTAALGGLTTAQAAAAAATVGAEGITAATLSAAVAEGAASVGANIGVAGATTAAASQGIGASISSAISSAAAMWPLAVIMGMYQSGKLYSAGVRPDAGEMWDSAGSTALGKAAMLPQTVGAKYFEVTDNILGKVVGGKMAAILSGSTLFQAVWSKVGSKLFGSGYETKDTGISLGVEGGALDAQQYVKQKKKGGLISGGSKTRFLYNDLDEETSNVLGTKYNEVVLGAGDLFTSLGIQLNESVLDGLNMASRNISTKDASPEWIQQQLDFFFAQLGDAAVIAISKATDAGLSGFSYVGLQAFVKNLQDVNGIIGHLNIGLYDMSVSGGFMAEQLSAWAGGIEALRTSAAGYYDKFFTDAEKAANTLSDVRKEFESIGVTLPESRQGYRDMVEGIDKTTEAGRAMLLTLMSLSGDASAAFDILESNANTATEAAKTLANTLAENLNAAVTGAMGAVQRAISAERDAATKAYNAQVTSLNDMVSTATENVSGLTSVGNDLSAALKALRGDSDDAVKMLRAQAQATLQSALATARAGGSLSGITGLSDALDTVSNNNTDLYVSLEDFNREQGRTANVIAELNEINGVQLTTEQQLLKTAEDQLDLAEDNYRLQMDRFDSQLAFAQSQLDALNGIDNSVISVTAALSGLSAAITAALAAKPAGSAAANTAANNSTLLDAVYQSVLGRDVDKEGAAYWGGLLQSGGIDYAGLVAAITKDAKANGELPAHAKGGLISGPGTGTSDSILSRLSNGEYVLRADAVRTYGTDLLDQMNAGQLPAFAGGGGIRLVGSSGAEAEATGAARYNGTSNASAAPGTSGASGGSSEMVERQAWTNRLLNQLILAVKQQTKIGMPVWQVNP